jgi:small subunit ribosomal protein S21
MPRLLYGWGIADIFRRASGGALGSIGRQAALMRNRIIPGLCPLGVSLLGRCWYSGGSPLSWVVQWGLIGEKLLVKIVLRERESIQEAVRRLRKIVERSGLKREVRSREYYEKPSDVKRKARNRAIRRAQSQSQPKVVGRP